MRISSVTICHQIRGRPNFGFGFGTEYG